MIDEDIVEGIGEGIAKVIVVFLYILSIVLICYFFGKKIDKISCELKNIKKEIQQFNKNKEK